MKEFGAFKNALINEANRGDPIGRTASKKKGRP